MCCSDACGEKVRDALAELYEDGRFKFFVEMQRHAEDQQSALKAECLEWLRDAVSSNNSGGK
jgi:hypothetical protein